MSAEGAGFLDLPPSVLALALSWVGHVSSRLASLGALTRTVHEQLSDDTVWHGLCRRHWYATDERLRNWPSLSSRSLFRALEMWVPAEGYYVLTPAFPWGLLVLVRIVDGHLTADIIRFVPSQDSEQFEEVFVRLFRISLAEEKPGVVRSLIEASWDHVALRNGQACQELMMSALDPDDLKLCRHLPLSYFSHWNERIVHEGLFTARRALRIADVRCSSLDAEPSVADASGLDGDNESYASGVDLPSWETGVLAETADAARKLTEDMISELMGSARVPCDLALVRNPQEYVPQDNDLPGIRPGLYVGDYGHGFYGQFRSEVLLVEHVTLSAAELREEVAQPTRLFRRPGSNPAPTGLERLADLADNVTFVRGIKQCGDFHVPMGATTFVAVSGPPAVVAAVNDRQTPPTSFSNRRTRRSESVLRTWTGFGTLAAPGFAGPSWAPGWLVQLQNNPETGNHRFGFLWLRNQDGVVLQWVRTQDNSPFLQRAWLPQDLQ